VQDAATAGRAPPRCRHTLQRNGFMKTLLTMVFAGCMAVSMAGAYAADEMMKKDGMTKKDEMKKDSVMKKDEMKKDGMAKKDEMKK
jgi:pentapeptide MXKDX repeat protein